MKRFFLAFALIGAFSSGVAAAPSAVVRNSVAVCDPNSPTHCMAPSSGGIKTGTYASAGAGQYSLGINAATSLTVPTGAAFAEICVENNAARYTDDGTTPTAATGIPVSGDSCFQYAGPLSALKFIAIVSGAVLDVSYYK